jgi:muramoyltetrapeptide carboxypeptidase LdcA involved in peptidoglycan recycling
MGTRPALRPQHLAPGDTVAVLSPSWGGPHAFPHVFERGLAVLRDWGLEVREYPSTRAPDHLLHADPQFRAADLNRAFTDPSVRAVIASIGGDDSIRLLPHLDAAVIAANPKILVGYSDTTTLLAAVRRLGLVTLHGPSVMAGFSQMGDLPPAYRQHVHDMLFDPAPAHTYRGFDGFAEGYPDWRDPSLAGLANALRPDVGPRVLQGSGRVSGELFGGCLEVLDWLRGTRAWPGAGEWKDRLLFFEPSEEKPGPVQVARILRAFGVLGVFDRDEGISGVLVGRARDHTVEETGLFEDAIRTVIGGEFGRPDLPIVANLPFGHTDPQWVLPLGVRAELDVDATTLRLVEPWLS